jgi:predicted phosphodiesterase
MARVLFLSDTHFPHVNKESLKKTLKLVKKYKPTHVIQCGDLLDMYSFSRYEKDANFTSPDSELQQGLEMARKMWADIRKIVPRAKCIQLIGNHEDRLNKTIARKAPELANLCKSIQDLYNFKGVQVLKSSKQHIEIDGVIYTHGHYTKLGDHAKFYRKSCVHGHSHRVGLYYEQTVDGLIWEMDCGYLADKDALPLQYTQSKFSKWVMAVGLIDQGQPQLITVE